MTTRWQRRWPPAAIGRRAMALLATIALASCAPTLLHARFAQTIVEHEMTELDPEPGSVVAADDAVIFVQIPLPEGWQKAMWGYSRGPLVMPPELQAPSLAQIKARCHLEPVGVVRLHGGAGGGWPRYEQILRRTARADNASIIVITVLTVELRGDRPQTIPLVAAITFAGDPAQVGCLYQRLGRPTVRRSAGKHGCLAPNKRPYDAFGIWVGYSKPTTSPAFCRQRTSP